ncbi:MAG TPA: nucleotide sugar dehydrogenase [Lentisphaeria bacterium]|nr:MAG: UDP-N-acetyl-D-glucosamine dehydrogenase [Lentisphaerae bacterium GWF2_38_69]HBM16492.1 nucleotide sugar dehydrogenase [Lentisphaeria bacterium]
MLAKFLEKIETKEAVIGVLGLGYVGLPLLIEFSKAGFRVVGFDIDPEKGRILNEGRSYIKHIQSNNIKKMLDTGKFKFYSDFSHASECDAVILCVPTPLTKQREPDMTYIVDSAEALVPYVRKDQLYCLESTTYPGTTDEILKPILEKSGLKAGIDFFLAFSPEREDPNNKDFSTSTIPKVVGGYNNSSLKAAQAMFNTVICKTVPVSSTAAAEATKLMENIFRCINIAMVNELKIIFDKMGIDIWEVINAAKTKPFGYMPFYPGPGLGGHCIPIDPFYLTWKAREFDYPTKFIELAGEINSAMPRYVVEKTLNALNDRKKTLNGSKVLIIGLAYKKNVDDIRESPSFKLWELLETKGATVDYYDPYCPEVRDTRHYPQYANKKSLTDLNNISDFEAVIISTDHDCIDFNFISKNSRLIIDTRNVLAANDNVIKA